MTQRMKRGWRRAGHSGRPMWRERLALSLVSWCKLFGAEYNSYGWGTCVIAGWSMA